MKRFIVGAICALVSSLAAADANNCVQDASDQYGTGMKNNCNRSIIVTYCFSDSDCDAPRGQGRDRHEIRPGMTLVIAGAGKEYHYHACASPDFPDGQGGCTRK